MGHYNHERKNQFGGRRWPLLQRKARIIQKTKPSSPECVKAPRKKGYSVTHGKSPCPCCLSGICGNARRWRPGSLHALSAGSAASPNDTGDSGMRQERFTAGGQAYIIVLSSRSVSDAAIVSFCLFQNL